jgi:hypothetical protein
MRSPTGARATVVVALCALTAALQLSDMRYETVRSSLIPGMFAPSWGLNRGVAVLREDPTQALLNRASGQPVAFLVRDIPNIRSQSAVRIGIEAKATGVTPGREVWQAARVLLWSYDSSGARLRYMPYEVLRLEGSSDWREGRLTVPVIPAVAAMRIVVVQAGQAGSMLVRGLTVDGVVESRPYILARFVLIGLWAAAGLWCVAGLFRRWSQARMVAAVVLAATLVGAFTPQPLLSDSIHDAVTEAQVAVEPVRVAMVRLTAPTGVSTQEASPVTVVTLESPPAVPAPTVSAPPIAPVPGPVGLPSPVAATPAVTTLLADFSPQLGVGWGHVVAFALLAASLSFAFPSTPRWQVLAGLLLFGVAIEAVQSFYITRGAEWGDVAQDGLGAALGLLAVSGFLFWRDKRKRPA